MADSGFCGLVIAASDVCLEIRIIRKVYFGRRCKVFRESIKRNLPPISILLMCFELVLEARIPASIVYAILMQKAKSHP